MSITEEQRKERKSHLGSSDIPAIMGYSRFATPFDIWLFKTSRIPYDPHEIPTEWQETGNAMELAVLEWSRQKGYIQTVERDVERPIIGTPIIVHVDGREVETGRAIEVKTEQLFGPRRDRVAKGTIDNVLGNLMNDYGEPGTNEIPEDVFLQGQTHILALNTDLCHVPTLIGGRGMGYYYTERNEQIGELIRRTACEFWEKYVLTDNPPPESVPSLNLIKRIRQVEGDPAEVAEELVRAWQNAAERAMAANKEKEAAQAAILAALDGRAEGVCPQGLITNYEQSRKGYVVEPCSFRVMRLKKAK